MSLLTAYDLLTDSDPRKFVSRVQRLTAAGAGLLLVAASAATGYETGHFLAFWFALAALLPRVFRPLIAIFVGVACALIVFMGDGVSGMTFRPLNGLALAPALIVCGILHSAEFAAAGVAFIWAWRSALAFLVPRA